MTRINNAGAGGPGPIAGPESTGNLEETSAAKESSQPKTNSASAETPFALPKPISGDNSAAGNLRATGDLLKSQLHSELEQMKGKVMNSEKELAGQLSQGLQRFAPPYVPVGSIVTEENLEAAAPTSGGIREMDLKPDQFQINDQGNLVITNKNLIDYFKSLKENATGENIRLGITQMKPPADE